MSTCPILEDLKDALQPGNAEGCSVEDLTNHYNSALTTVLDKHAPARVKMVTIRPKQPWFSDDLYGSKCEKRKWERKWRDTNLTVHYDLFKTARTKFNNMLLQAKKDYYNNMILSPPLIQKTSVTLSKTYYIKGVR